MKPTCTVLLLLFLLTLGHAQSSAPDADAYTQELAQFISRLQKKPWMGWKAGTEVTLRYFVARDAAGKPLGIEQPDMVFKVIEADKFFETTQVVKGKVTRHEFLVKDQPGLDAAQPVSRVVEPGPAELEIDGFKLSCRVTELTLREIGGPTAFTTKEWVLTNHPSIVLRKDSNAGGWSLASAHVTRRIGDKNFSCVKIRSWIRFYSGGPADSLTTYYLCPDVPGHLVEEITEFFKIKKGQRSATPFQVVHRKVVEIKQAN